MAKKICFIGAGSTIFMKNILGDVLHYPALKNAHIALMDIDETRLLESQLVAQKLISPLICHNARRWMGRILWLFVFRSEALNPVR